MTDVPRMICQTCHKVWPCSCVPNNLQFFGVPAGHLFETMKCGRCLNRLPCPCAGVTAPAPLSLGDFVGQPPPVPNDGPRIVDLVLQDLSDRAERGKAKYGVYLQPNNGRNALQDAYEEALDLAMYLRQKIEEEKKAK